MPDPTYDLERLVTVETFSAPWEAQLARARLDAEGIHSVIADENFVRLYWPLSNSGGGVRLQVHEEDAARAADLLRTERPIPEIYLVTEEEAAGPGVEEPAAEAEPMEIEDLVTVARFATPWEAHLAKTRLQSDGIDAAVFEERLPMVSLLSGEPRSLNRLEVHREDAERALAILDAVETAEGEGF